MVEYVLQGITVRQEHRARMTIPVKMEHITRIREQRVRHIARSVIQVVFAMDVAWLNQMVSAVPAGTAGAELVHQCLMTVEREISVQQDTIARMEQTLPRTASREHLGKSQSFTFHL